MYDVCLLLFDFFLFFFWGRFFTNDFFVSQIVPLFFFLCGELVRVALADGRLLWELLLIFLGKGLISATVMNFDAELFEESAEVASLDLPTSSITEADGKLTSSLLMLKDSP